MARGSTFQQYPWRYRIKRVDRKIFDYFSDKFDSRFLNFDRYDATKISFYLSVPAIAGASFLSLKDVFTNEAAFNSLIILSVFLSFIFSYITIKYFLIFIKNFNFNLFIIYRIILSLFIFYIIYS